MARAPDPKTPEEQRRRERYDRPDNDTSGQYGSLDQDLAYGGGRDPGNLGHYGRETTTHNYGGDEGREEMGWESGSRPVDDASDSEAGTQKRDCQGGKDPRR